MTADRFPPVLAARRTRSHRQHLLAGHEQVFPLLCPAREHDWLPGWDARIIHSESGVAERGAVFVTQHDDTEVIWLIAEHRPASHLRFVRWHRDEMLVDLELDLSSPQPDRTWLDIRYTWTAISPIGTQRLAAMTDVQWQAQMGAWERHLNAYLQTGRR